MDGRVARDFKRRKAAESATSHMQFMQIALRSMTFAFVPDASYPLQAKRRVEQPSACHSYGGQQT